MKSKTVFLRDASNRLAFLILHVFALASPFKACAGDQPGIVWSTNAHPSSACTVSFSADGRMLASAGSDNMVRIWQVSSGALLQSITNGGYGPACAIFSPRGDSLAVYAGGVTLLLRVTNWTEAWSVPRGSSAVAFTPDGSALAASDTDPYTTIRLYRVADGVKLRDFGHSPFGIFAHMEYTPDGRFLGTSLSGGGNIRIIDMSTYEYTNDFAGVFAFAFAPNTSLIAVANERNENYEPVIRLRALADKALIKEYREIGVEARQVRFSPDGRLLLSRSYDQTIRIWIVTEGKPLRIFSTAPNNTSFIAVSPDNRHFAYALDDGRITVARLPIYLRTTIQNNTHAVISWTGGSGPYQLQQRTNLTLGSWLDSGPPTTNTSTTNLFTTPMFYRVQRLND